MNGVTNFDTSNGILSVQSISEAGEFFEFSQYQGDWSDTVGLTFGLFDETTYDRADLEVDEAGNAVKALLRLRIKNSPFVFKDPASTYGRLNELGFSNQVDTRTVFRVGLDADRRAFISMQLEDSTFQVITRTETAIAIGTELKFVAVFPLANTLSGVRGMTVNKLSTGPELTWYYIESPDGVFTYPLFSTEEQANYADEEYGTAADDAGQNHPHTFIDELPASQVWYMPNSYMFHDQSSAPVPPAGVAYNEIATGADANYIPSAFGPQSITINEGAAFNLQIVPAGDANTYNLTGIPAGLAFNGANLVGTAPEVAGDNVTTPSEDHVITVTKANDYGSSVGTLTITVNNLTAPTVAIAGFTHVAGSTPLVDPDTLADGSVVSLDNLLDAGNRLHIDSTFLSNQVLPELVTSDNGSPTDPTVEKFFVGVPMSGADFSNGISAADFLVGVMYQRNGASSIRSSTIINGVFSNSLGMSTGSTLDWEIVIQNYGTEVELGIAASSTNPESIYSFTAGGSWTTAYQQSPTASQPRQVVMGIQNSTMDISASGITELANPTPPTVLTNWTKAVDFSGGAERAEMVSVSHYYNPMMMDYQSVVTSAPSTPGNTSNDTAARPWATAVVFSPDGNNSNQHIWNLGEGAGSTDDNIYLRIDQFRNLYFGWGRDGSWNEYYIARVAATSYNGVYVGFNGTRFGGTTATPAALDAAFDIRLMFSTGGPTSEWNFNPNPTAQGWGQWTSSQGRTDRLVAGSLTIGGRGTNRNFHGKVASFVTTTLRRNAAMPDSTEIAQMITDPIGWLNDYKVGNDYRPSHDGIDFQNFLLNNLTAASATQVYLMGDGTSDSYSNMIRNQVFPSEQSYTKLNLLSMQSNDIETVNIVGLS